jgi:exodeoxyribonuclease VII large subunit
VADGAELLGRLSQLRRRLERPTRERLMRARTSLDSLRRGVLQRDGEKLLREPAMRLDTARAQLVSALRSSMDLLAARLAEARNGHRAHHPAKVLERRLDNLKQLGRRLESASVIPLDRHRERLVRLRGLLRALGPESAFQRGFSITLGADGRVIRSAEQLKPGDAILTKFAVGEVKSTVTGSEI